MWAKPIKKSPVRRQRIFTKLKIGSPGDKYEQEADRVADTVMRMQDRGMSRYNISNEPLQMQPIEEEEEELQMQPIGEEEESLQMQPIEDEEEELLQPKCKECEEKQRLQMEPAISGAAGNSNLASDGIHRKISESKGSGQPLEAGTQREMSGKIGADFSDVRVHTGSKSKDMSQSLGARAFTVGNDIFFNSNQYAPGSSSGKRLLAHELTHTVQQGSSVPAIQKKDKDDSSKSGSESDPLAKLLRGLIRKELADKKFQKHLGKLGKALGKLALKETGKTSDSPTEPVKRLTALNIPQLFKSTSEEIVKDPQLKHVRKRIIEIVGTNDLTALVSALAAGLAAYLADVDLTGKPSVEIGAGFTVGGMFNLGSAKDIQFKEVQHYVQYSNEHFKARLTGGLKNKEADEKTGEEKHLVGSGTGEIRVGTKLSHLMTRVSYNSDGELVVLGRFSSGTTFGKNEKLLFTADVSHLFATGETLFTPKIAGRFNLGSDQSLSIGSSLQFSNQKGLNKLTGYVEYKHDYLYLRLEGSMKGFEGIKSISPGNEMVVQGRLIIPLF